MASLFFCWRLLGLIPGGAPFSQLNRGVKDAMVESTKLVECQFMTKHAKRPKLKTRKKKEKEGNHPQIGPRLQKRARVKSYRQHLCRSNRRNDIGRRWLWWNQKGSTYARANVQVAKGGGYVGNKFTKCWPLIEYFLWNTDLWEVKCEVNPPASTSLKQKWWNSSETWNCTHLRVRSVYLGLAKQRQRRKRKKQPMRGPARHRLQRYSRSGSKWWQQKAQREGSIQRNVKLCGLVGVMSEGEW